MGGAGRRGPVSAGVLHSKTGLPPAKQPRPGSVVEQSRLQSVDTRWPEQALFQSVLPAGSPKALLEQAGIGAFALHLWAKTRVVVLAATGVPQYAHDVFCTQGKVGLQPVGKQVLDLTWEWKTTRIPSIAAPATHRGESPWL